MIYSMTGFARVHQQAEWGEAAWELRSVNHRYLELNLRLPEQVRDCESLVREVIKATLQRGKIDVTLRFQPKERANGFAVDQELVNQLLQAHDQLKAQSGVAGELNATTLLRWPGVLQAQDHNMDAVKKTLLQWLDAALDQLLAQRQREGERITELMLEKLTLVEQQVAIVEQAIPAIQAQQHEKLMARFEEAQVKLDAERLEQELVMLAQKMDVAEECDRLKTHCQEMRHSLEKGGVVGRRLDFLLQEFNREANTLGSKSVDTQTTQAAVELKVTIEQMREQIQNLE